MTPDHRWHAPEWRASREQARRRAQHKLDRVARQRERNPDLEARPLDLIARHVLGDLGREELFTDLENRVYTPDRPATNDDGTIADGYFIWGTWNDVEVAYHRGFLSRTDIRELRRKITISDDSS